ncbi:MAG: DUF4241 domain-containing protein [Paracoccaceae bacterium]|nr:DUF4241 domain-containing protein [Paracoccaceae bacterium]
MEWIIAETGGDLGVELFGAFSTFEAKLSFVDPLCATQATFFSVPASKSQLVLFSTNDGYWSKLALVYSNEFVCGGRHELDCDVDGGAVSPVTPASLEALNAFRATLPTDYPKDSPNHRYPAPNLYIEHFEQYDEEDAAPWNATLPDGTPVPFIRSGYGDGTYPVFTLVAEDGSVCAAYCDFFGSHEKDNWIMPPGMTAI